MPFNKEGYIRGRPPLGELFRGGRCGGYDQAGFVGAGFVILIREPWPFRVKFQPPSSELAVEARSALTVAMSS